MYISDCTIPPEFWYSKVNLLATYIRTVSKTICIPSSNVFIDEMIARFSGRSAHTVRIKNKPTPKGYKILSFCDAGYTYTFIFTSRIQIHPEIQQVSDLSKVGNEVYYLTSQLPIEDKLFNIYMDNYFFSIKLFKYLCEKKIGACGTVRTNSANFLKVLKANKKLDWNTLSGVVVDNVLAILWMDNGSVMMLSTIHQIDNENENQIERVRCRPRETINTNINHKDFRLQIVWDLIEESLKESEKKLHIRNQVDELTNQFKFIYVDPQQYVTAKYELPIIRLFPEDHYPEWRETKSSCV
ncbi:unnamed protein product [Rhizophagus irregularis]|uniref:PiggyBac transposable element-derived protein domain-containing protein n=1 Tax=Rhizophagus irregularis TaxID=588596 RepID=A0A915ZKD5_9GLOM|nr:unnamed protein product [Rhizophagus irregularis]